MSLAAIMGPEYRGELKPHTSNLGRSESIPNCGATREPFEGVKIIFKGVKTIVKGVTKPARAKPKRVRRPSTTGRAKVPTEGRMDNQLIKLLRGMDCTVGNDSRKIDILMGKLSDVLGRVDIPTIEAHPEMLKAYHIVKEKADAVVMERSIPGGKKRTVYLPEYQDSLELLLTKDGLIILCNALSAGALAADLMNDSLSSWLDCLLDTE